MVENGEDPALPGIDTSTPNTAGVYDYLLGGTNSFPADQAMAKELLRLVPDTGRQIRENREFLGRAVRDLVTTKGITQFLDIGSGLPTNDNVHQIAQRTSADSRVVYVDHDPMVVRHAELLLAGTNGVTIFQEDVRNPANVLERAEAVLDLSQPVALLLVAILHFVPDAEIGTFFDGLDLLEPGLALAGEWRPDGTRPVRDDPVGFLAGVGRKR
jgi:S-adenosyl methyltransferase